MKINHKELKEFIKIAYETKTPLFIWGTTGIGKSDSVKNQAKDLAKEQGLEFSDTDYEDGKFGFIETEPILTSYRRFEQGGRFKIYLKYLLCEIYMLFLGPVKSDIFKYKFNHYSKNNKNKI